MQLLNLLKGPNGKMRRIKIGIRPQLIILVSFSSLFSLLVLALVIGIYVSNIVTDLNAERLKVIAQLKQTQLQQSLQFLFYQVLWLSQRSSLQIPLSNYRAGNYSSSVFSGAQLSLEQFLASSDVFASARLYNIASKEVASASAHNSNISIVTTDKLYILSNATTVPEAVLGRNESYAIPAGHLSGPAVQDYSLASNFTSISSISDTPSTLYFLGLTLPVYANSSIIFRESSVSGYLTVIMRADSIYKAFYPSLDATDYQYSVIEPIYQQNASNSTSRPSKDRISGFRSLFPYINNSFPLSPGKSAARTALYSDYDDTATKQQFLGNEVAIGFSKLKIDASRSWSVIVSQSSSEFYKRVHKLTDIIIGVVVGIGVIVCLITFPLAVWFVEPITKLKNAIESITRSKKEKEKEEMAPVASGESASSSVNMNGLLKRFSVNTVSSGSSTVHSSGIRLPDRIPQSKKLFKDEITELSEAFNIMTGELEKQYSHLEDRVKLRTRELEASKIEAEAANEAKTVFIANISHELRTPLNGILGMTSIALEETDQSQIQDSLKLIHRSGELLLHILTELLTYSKNTLNRSKLEKSNFQILEVVHQVKSIFSKLARDQRVNFKITLKPSILRKLILLGDSNRIIQVVMNLVSNSLKFTPVDGSVDVTIKLLGEYDENASSKIDYAQVLIKKPFDQEVSKNGENNKLGVDSEKEENNAEHKSESVPVFQIDRRDSTVSSIKNDPQYRSSQNLSQLLDNTSIATFSTTEYDDLMFRSQFDHMKSPSVSPSETPSPSLEIKEKTEILDIPSSSEIASKERSTEKDLNPQILSDLSLYQFDSRESSITDLSTNELVKNNEVYHMKNLYVPKSWAIQFEVRDTGSGIEPALQDKVFEPFIQGDQTLSRSYGGTGLGLSICRQLAKMMHGTLTLKSDIGKGSIFTFTVPLPQSGEVVVPPEKMQEFCEDEFNPLSKSNRKVLFNIEEPSSDIQTTDGALTPSTSIGEKHVGASKNKKPSRINLPLPQSSVGTVDQTPTGETCLDNISHLKILVAEDNSVNQEVIKRMLKLEGFTNVTMAANGAEAVDLVKKSYETMALYDIIFMDVQMPKMDGLTATKIIRNNLKFRKPIVALTAFADESNVKECLNSGMSAFLSKPIKRTNLRQLVVEISPELLKDLVTTPSTYIEGENQTSYFSPESTKK